MTSTTKNASRNVAIAAISIACAATASAQIVFADNFNSGASPLWGNETGNWSAGGGVYNAQNQFAGDISSLPYVVTDIDLEVDINDVADGGVWLRCDEGGQNGVLLVTGGNGWGFGNSGGGRSLYWHIVHNGSAGPIINSVNAPFNPGVTDVHLRVTVVGDIYSVYLDGSATPMTTFTTNAFPRGRVGLYDFSQQTFDNFEMVATASCPADLDGSGEVDSGDIGLMLLDFGPCPGCPSDLDGSGEVDGGDIGLALLDFGPCP
ncbi:MAG: hypothetical protein K8R92_04640 [Planctomycetes bacterium]|nr:hypothetical protein [Planctomycetota bacterium]